MKPFDLKVTAMVLIGHQVGTNTWAAPAGAVTFPLLT